MALKKWPMASAGPPQYDAKLTKANVVCMLDEPILLVTSDVKEGGPPVFFGLWAERDGASPRKTGLSFKRCDPGHTLSHYQLLMYSGHHTLDRKP
jgi:hypothetical protein